MAKKLSKNKAKLSPKQKFQLGDIYDPFGVPTEFDDPKMTQSNLALGKLANVDYSKQLQKPRRNQFENIKPHDMIQFGLYGVDAMLRKNEAMRNQQAFNQRFRNIMIQNPVDDYTRNKVGPPTILAEDGAEIRRGTSPDYYNAQVEIEGGEFLLFPDGTTQHVQGPSHAKGGVHTNLPEGTKVFSNYIKPKGKKGTYANIAKKYPLMEWKEVLDNPYASDIDRNTAKMMYERNFAALNALFEDQQLQNGNSDGTDQAQESQEEMMGKFGLDLRKGENLSFTDPFEYGGEYIGGMAHFQDGGDYENSENYSASNPYLEEDYFIPNRGVSYQEAIQADQEVEDMEAENQTPIFKSNKWSLPPEEEKEFQKFFSTLPPNLKVDDNTYNIRGYWDALGKPSSFDYNQPVESDGYYHAFSRHPRTGMLLKDPSHPTYQLAVQEDKNRGYSFMTDPTGNIYSISPEDMPTEGYFANYQDGGQFKMMGDGKSTYYQNTTGDTSNLTIGTDERGSAKFQDGGYFSPEGKRYKLPKGAVVKKEDDKTIKAGDFVQRADGTIVKVNSLQAKMIAKSSASSKAKDYAEGKLYLQGWVEESPENAAKLKLAEDAIAKGIKAGQITETKPAGWKEGDPKQITILGTFKPSFKERMAISEVVNKTGKGFGTSNYQIVGQKQTEGYSKTNKEGNYKGTGSFVGGMTPQDYEQRATYERALAEGKSPEEAEALATTTDKKQKAENRRRYLTELKYDVTDVPDNVLVTDDFYKNRYEDITNAIEGTFAEAGFRPAIGDDKLSGWEHYDAASYARTPLYGGVPVEEPAPPPQTFPETSYGMRGPDWQPMPSKMGKFPAYQAAPQALGFLSGLSPYNYYTPDYTHYEVAPPTLNIDPLIQSIDDSLQSGIRQTTGNASIDSARKSALFNQALEAKQKVFAAKQNYDAEARFKADIYNADARTKENYLDVTAATQVFNEYMPLAQDAAERERLAAVSGLTNNMAKYYQDEYKKMLMFSTLIPDFYYEGTDLMQPIKINPYSKQSFYSNWQDRYNASKGIAPKATPVIVPVNINQTTPTPSPTEAPVVPGQKTSMRTSRGFSPSIDFGSSPYFSEFPTSYSFLDFESPDSFMKLGGTRKKQNVRKK